MWVPARGGTALLGWHKYGTYADDEHTSTAEADRGEYYEMEAAFDRSALEGDPYPTRVIRLYLSLTYESGSATFGTPKVLGQILITR